MQHRMLILAFATLSLLVGGCARQQQPLDLREPLPEGAMVEPVDPSQLDTWC